MKKLIFLAFLAIPLQSFAQTPTREVPTAEDAQAIVSQIKDVEVTQMISETAEFRNCREKYPFSASDTPAQRTAKLRDAETCFKEKLSRDSSPERLKQLSEALNLQSYKLVKGNSSKEVQEYLTKKMITALTGVDPDDRNEQTLKENLKFGKKKIVDQSVFIDLYKTQLGKNALFEISRFCFENLRSNNPPRGSNNFIDHWKDNTTFQNIDLSNQQTLQQTIQQALPNVNDLGQEKFGSFTDPTEKSKIYDEIFKSIQGNPASGNNQNIQNFIQSYFMKCGFMIEPLCKKFKDNTALVKTTDTQSQLELGLTSAPANATGSAQGAQATTTPNSPVGAAACLSLNRIREYKQAIANTNKVAEYFRDQMTGGNNLTQFMKGLEGEPIQIFGSGTDSREPTIDDLTNNTANSFLDGNLSDQRTQDKISDCENQPELDECAGVVYKTEDLDKIKQKIELEQTLKREVEMERVRKLVDGDRQDLETYLKENGFYDILNDQDVLNDKQKLIEAVGKTFEAKKLAMLNEINNRLGRRQAKDDNDLQTRKDSLIPEIREDSKEERARLAQVVMFNNIITSHITLARRVGDRTEQAGRNVGAWRKEESALNQDGVDTSLFTNLKAPEGDDSGSGVGNSQISDFSVLDNILGKVENQQSGN